ncbi:hypothetical protein Tco_1149019 [Tanacetum coccineum]
MEQLTSMYDMVGQYIQKKEEEKRIEEEQAAKARYWKIPVCYDDDDEESSIPLKDIIISGLPPCVAITPDSPKTDSLIIVDKRLDTIPETESDEFIKSSIENLVQNPSESEDEFKSTRFLAPLSTVIDTLLLFSSENEVKVFNHVVLAYKEKSPPSSSHRGLKASKLSLHKSPMLIHGDNTLNLGVRHPYFYPP